ncbi:MAG: helix-turn-helix transcriptional regulator [Firmicutes bacterium]|nr:helix-turn-helix transcriptional regulator [Bacillota bacterium]
MTKSEKLKSIILSRFRSLREFSAAAGIPNTTLVSALDRGIDGMAIEKVIKICDFLNIDIRTFEPLNDNPSIQNISDEQFALISKYDFLDRHGREMVDIILEKEFERMTAQNELKKKSRPKVVYIDYFSEKVSAGYGFDLYDATKERLCLRLNKSTARADFAVTVTGDSMLPKYKNGDTLLVHSQPDIEIGEIGIFITEGKGYVKKRGERSLISLNSSYPDISALEYEFIRCKGKVIDVLNPDWIVD